MNGHVRARLAAATGAVLLGIPLALAPIGAASVAAAGNQLTLVGAATYDVQPEHRRVHITVDLTATNRAKGTLTTGYVYDRVNLSVLPGTSGFRATDGGTRVGVSVLSHAASATLLSIHLAKRLASGKSASIRLSFELPDPGKPASRPVRIGPSIAAFPVWAYGSRGTPGSSVTVRFPAGFKVSSATGRLGKPSTAADGTTTLSSPFLADPYALSGYVLADRAGAYLETPVDVTVDGVAAHFAVRGWKDDPAWTKRTTALLKKAIPSLGKTIGLAYPRTDTIAVEEVVARSIDGLAGVFDPASNTIRIAYTAGPEVLVRQAAHLWFDGSVLADRWAVEGLATLAADGAAKQLGLATPTNPAIPASASAAFPLNDWVADPGRGATVAAIETYGYAASARLVRLIAARAGPDGLQAVLRAAAARATTSGPTDWRGLLDLLKTEAGVDATDLWRTWVVRSSDAALLDTRARLAFERAALVGEAGQLDRLTRDRQGDGGLAVRRRRGGYGRGPGHPSGPRRPRGRSRRGRARPVDRPAGRLREWRRADRRSGSLGRAGHHRPDRRGRGLGRSRRIVLARPSRIARPGPHGRAAPGAGGIRDRRSQGGPGGCDRGPRDMGRGRGPRGVPAALGRRDRPHRPADDPARVDSSAAPTASPVKDRLRIRDRLSHPRCYTAQPAARPIGDARSIEPLIRSRTEESSPS